MSLYFVNLRDGDHVYADEIGIDLPRASDLVPYALQAARNMIAEEGFPRMWPKDDERVFEVRDEESQLVVIIPFSDAYRAN